MCVCVCVGVCVCVCVCVNLVDILKLQHLKLYYKYLHKNADYRINIILCGSFVRGRGASQACDLTVAHDKGASHGVACLVNHQFVLGVYAGLFRIVGEVTRTAAFPVRPHRL